MRVLEVGPGEYPVDRYLADPGVDYVGAELGVWDGNNSGFADDQFYAAMQEFRPSGDGVRFYYEPVSAIVETGFDLEFAANVFGDPRSIDRNDKGELVYPEQAERILAEALATRLKPSGSLEILETYTPIDRDLLIDILGKTGFKMELLIEGSDLEDLVKLYYSRQAEVMVKRIQPMVRLEAALVHNLPVRHPYFARFRL